MNPFEDVSTEQENLARGMSTVNLSEEIRQPPRIKLEHCLGKTGRLSLKARIFLARRNGGITDEVKDLLLQACDGFEQDDSSRMVRMARALGRNVGCTESAEFMDDFLTKAGVGFNLGTWKNY